jgi:HEAT repeat protein
MSKVWLSLLVLAGVAWSHGGGHRRPPGMPPPNGGVPPGLRPPPGTPPTTPPGTPPPPTPPTPTTPPQGPIPAPTPPPSQPSPQQRPSTNPRTGRAANDTATWRIWWEYNREYLLGLRHMVRKAGAGTITGRPVDANPDPMAGRRAEVRDALRALVDSPQTHEKLKSASFIALGRLGTTDDVERFLKAIGGSEHEDTRAAAVLGIGLLPPVEDAALRDKIRRGLETQMATGGKGSRRVWEFAYVAAGLRARYDRRLLMTLARDSASRVWDSLQGAALVYSCGVTKDTTLLAEVMLAARKGTLGGHALHDLGRSHAVTALGLLRAPMACDLLARLLRSRRAGIQTRRSAALSLGRLLREAELSEDQVKTARQVLMQVLEKGKDAALRGYAAIALAGAREPAAIQDLMQVVDRGGNQEVKTYAALALGLAARRVDEKQAKKIRRFLIEELGKTKAIEMSSSLTIAAGLAGATEAAELLRHRVAKASLPATVRGAAAEALGLLGQRDKETGEALLEALRHGPPDLVEGATLGLGLLGRRDVAPELVKRLEGASSGILQGSLTVALGHLGQNSAVDPLLKTLRDEKQKRVVRDLAAVALGLLGDPREQDLLFELDAYFNYFATTTLTYELLTIF